MGEFEQKFAMSKFASTTDRAAAIERACKEQAKQLTGSSEAVDFKNRAQLLGKVRDGVVVWFDQNPHAFPEGTEFYAVVERRKDKRGK